MFYALVVMNQEDIIFVQDSFSIKCERYLFIDLKPSLSNFLKIQTIFHKNHETSFLYLNIINVVFMCIKEALWANSALKLGWREEKADVLQKIYWSQQFLLKIVFKISYTLSFFDVKVQTFFPYLIMILFLQYIRQFNPMFIFFKYILKAQFTQHHTMFSYK